MAHEESKRAVLCACAVMVFTLAGGSLRADNGLATREQRAVPEKYAQVVTVKNPSVTQKGALFTPRVLPVVGGTTVDWPSNDDILHNVFSFSETKPFDLGLYRSPTIESVRFDKPGKVDVFCSIHARMNCIVL